MGTKLKFKTLLGTQVKVHYIKQKCNMVAKLKSQDLKGATFMCTVAICWFKAIPKGRLHFPLIIKWLASSNSSRYDVGILIYSSKGASRNRWSELITCRAHFRCSIHNMEIGDSTSTLELARKSVEPFSKF